MQIDQFAFCQLFCIILVFFSCYEILVLLVTVGARMLRSYPSHWKSYSTTSLLRRLQQTLQFHIYQIFITIGARNLLLLKVKAEALRKPHTEPVLTF